MSPSQNHSWLDFLEASGARLAADGVADFGDPNSERAAIGRDPVLMDLSPLSLLSARGEDAQTFLGSQFTNDVRLASAEHTQLNGYCSAQGRLLAIMMLWQQDGAFMLQLPAALIEPLQKRLRMFVLRAKVTLENVSNAWARIGIAGPGCEQILRERLGDPPAQPGAIASLAPFTVVRAAGAVPRFQVLTPAAEMPALWSELRGRARPVGSDAWRWFDVIAGLPQVYPATQDAFVPQMVNLQLVDGVSFKKGCYPGQEIVARMQYLGRLKRRMYLAHCAQDASVRPGDEVFQAANGETHKVGQIVDAVPAPAGGLDLLAVLEIAAAADCGASAPSSAGGGEVMSHPHNLHLGSAEGPVLQLRDLPYAVPEPNPTRSTPA